MRNCFQDAEENVNIDRYIDNINKIINEIDNKIDSRSKININNFQYKWNNWPTNWKDLYKLILEESKKREKLEKIVSRLESEILKTRKSSKNKEKKKEIKIEKKLSNIIICPKCNSSKVKMRTDIQQRICDDCQKRLIPIKMKICPNCNSKNLSKYYLKTEFKCEGCKKKFSKTLKEKKGEVSVNEN